MKPKYSDIRRALKDIPFKPDEPGFMKIVTDVNDPSYWVNRAIEELKSLMDIDDRDSDAKLRLAIQLLAYTRAYKTCE